MTLPTTMGWLGAAGSQSVSSTWPCSERMTAAEAPAASTAVGCPCVCSARASRVGTCRVVRTCGHFILIEANLSSDGAHTVA
jgi:hypothetical protein